MGPPPWKDGRLLEVEDRSVFSFGDGRPDEWPPDPNAGGEPCTGEVGMPFRTTGDP